MINDPVHQVTVVDGHIQFKDVGMLRSIKTALTNTYGPYLGQVITTRKKDYYQENLNKIVHLI
jgi:hypothetical protein